MQLLLIDPITGYLLVSGLIGGAWGTYMNWKSQKDINERNIEEAKLARYQEQQQADKNWERQNAYNDPKQQMIRLKQAGLNPNLVYGRGADNTAGAIQTITKTPPTATAPRLELDKLQTMAQDYGQIKQTQAMTENTQQATLTNKANEQLTNMNIAKTAQETAKSKFELSQAQELKDQVILNAKLENKMKSQTIEVTADRNQREALANTSNIAKTAQDILKSKQDMAYNQMLMSNNPQQQEYLQKQIQMLGVAIENAKNDGKVKKWQADLSDMGISISDPHSLRMLYDTKFKAVPQDVKKAFTPNWEKMEYNEEPNDFFGESGS